jgi:hypothetical protein
VTQVLKMSIWTGALLLACAAPAYAASDVKAGISAWSAGDYAKAVEIWRPLASAGNADAQFNLAQAFKLGRGVPIDLAAAQGYYERAARQGHRDAQTSLGLTLFGNGDRIGAMRWLKLAADRGEPRAMLVYGTALFNGDGVAVDQVRAYAMVSRASAQGMSGAASTLAEMDQLIPVSERQRGVALALQMAGKPPTATVAKDSPPVNKIKAPARSAAVPAAPAATGSWRIQLGAFGQRSTAESLYERLSAGGALSGKPPIFTQVGTMTRLQIGSYPNRAAAASACASLRGQACFPVK